ncbi:lysosomal alpha-mannosidase-like [Rhipicephalus sanguineus]|uniref:lysosomal alpha-mannosidase-like n=1 Tax=Rhipicephalus sanguineus TaxID=34632 RepID=UPI0018962C18|nr:lysosomal alpha-mannosidase-like [Rhipicephalus sanguineus]
MYWKGPGPALGANQCELRGCPQDKPGYINMHVLSHSHMDVGWLQTVDEIYRTVVRSIYNSTIRGLAQNVQRRFVAAESAYFSRWWNEQSDEVKQMVRHMVNSGQLQFVGGGWVQNDEAVTHYTAIIDQMTLGLRFLNDTFGPQCGVPSVAWQADPFGHSVSQASLFARMGFGSLMIGRISLELKENWTLSRSLEFVWQADPPRQGKSISSHKNIYTTHPPLSLLRNAIQRNPDKPSPAPPIST